MRSRRAVLQQVLVAALAAWLCVILMSGVTAAVAFPTLKTLNPSLPGFESVSDHWKIAGGQVAMRVFRVAGIAEMALAALCTLAWFASQPSERPQRRLVFVPLVLSIGALAWGEGVLFPRMRAHLSTFLDAARAGDAVRAGIARAAFDLDHPTSTRLLSLHALAVLFSLLAVVWTRSREPSPTPDAAA